MNGCKYCTGDCEELIDTRTKLSRKTVLIIPGIEAWIDAGELTVAAVSDTYESNYQEESVPINFCPMCGRKLREVEVVDIL